jgi:hypothetical protein
LDGAGYTPAPAWRHLDGRTPTVGLTEKAIRGRVETGILQPLFVGVFLVAGSPRTWEQRITAAVRWGGDGAVGSYKSATALWRFDGFELRF